MPTKPLAVFSTLLLFLSGTTLFLYFGLRQAAHRSTTEQLERGRLVDRVAELEGELEATRKRLTEERAAAARAAVEAQQALEHAAGHVRLAKGVQKPTTNAPPEANMIRSLNEADDIARELVARNDARGMLLLLEDLLAMGDPGFKKLCKLATELNLADTIREGDQLLMRPEFHRFFYHRSEELLRFGLFLDSQKTEHIPDRLRNDFLLSDEELSLLLGFYPGESPEVLQGYTRKFRLRAEAEVAAGGGKVQDSTLRGLARIPTDEAVDVLVDLLPRVSTEHQTAILSALVWQGNPRAVPALYLLRDGTADLNQRSRIDDAIQRLK